MEDVDSYNSSEAFGAALSHNYLTAFRSVSVVVAVVEAGVGAKLCAKQSGGVE